MKRESKHEHIKREVEHEPGETQEHEEKEHDEGSEEYDGGKWIGGAIKHPGALHEQLGVPEGEKIPEGKLEKAASSGGKLGKRARLAETLKGMHDGEPAYEGDAPPAPQGPPATPPPPLGGGNLLPTPPKYPTDPAPGQGGMHGGLTAPQFSGNRGGVPPMMQPPIHTQPITPKPAPVQGGGAIDTSVSPAIPPGFGGPVPQLGYHPGAGPAPPAGAPPRPTPQPMGRGGTDKVHDAEEYAPEAQHAARPGSEEEHGEEAKEPKESKKGKKYDGESVRGERSGHRPKSKGYVWD